MNEQIMQAARALAQLLADSREHQLVQRMEQEALADETVQRWLEGKTVRKVVVVPGRLVNIAAG